MKLKRKLMLIHHKGTIALLKKMVMRNWCISRNYTKINKNYQKNKKSKV